MPDSLTQYVIFLAAYTEIELGNPCVSLVQGFVLPGAYNYIYLLLRSMFTGLDIKMAKKLYVMSLNKSDNITYRNAVNDAFKSINPIIL